MIEKEFEFEMGHIVSNTEVLYRMGDMGIKALAKEDIERNRTILKIQIKEKSDMELKETVEMMLSEDYKERFKAEYWQTKIRYERLHNICVKAQAGTLDFELTCPLQLLDHQRSCMGGYLRDLEVRAEIEGISLQ